MKISDVNTYHLGDGENHEKLLASATAVTLLTVGYSSAAFAEKIQTTRIAVTLKQTGGYGILAQQWIQCN